MLTKEQIKAEMQQIIDGSGPTLTDTEQKQFDALVSMLDVSGADALKDLQKPASGWPIAARPKRPDVGQPHSGMPADENNRPIIIPAQASRYRLKHFKGPNAVQTAYSFGRYMMAISGDPGSIGWCHNNGINIYATSSSEGTNSLGGYIVPEQFSSTIIDLRDSYGSFRKYARIAPMTSDTLNIPRRASGLTGYWVGESQTITESNKVWNNVALSLKKLAALTRMTNELAEDAIVLVSDDLIDEIGYCFAYNEDLAGFVGDGTSTYGGITGACAALQTAAGTPTTTSAGGIVVGSDVHMASLVLGDLTALIGRCLPRGLKNARWYCSPVFYSDVMLRLLYGAGGLSASDMTNGVQQNFIGYPVELNPAFPSTDLASQILCLFGDLSLSSTLGDRNGISLEMSGSAVVGGESTFEKDQKALRGRERLDIVNHDLGSSTKGGPLVGLQALNA